jgi:predicted transcriptional regulator
VRLDRDRVAALDAVARRNRETRSDVIRRAIDRELAAA